MCNVLSSVMNSNRTLRIFSCFHFKIECNTEDTTLYINIDLMMVYYNNRNI